jgi:hypothetical protein
MDPPGTLSQRTLSAGDIVETPSKAAPEVDPVFVPTATLVPPQEDDTLSQNNNNNHIPNSSLLGNATFRYQSDVASGRVSELTYKNQVLSSRHVTVLGETVSEENTEKNTSTVPPPPSEQEKESVVQKLVQTHQYPQGLAERLYDSTRQTFTHHFWIIDNSGSMLTTDCHRVVSPDVLDVGGAQPQKIDVVKCSRWNELQATILAQAQLSCILRAPTTFRFLNHPTLSKQTGHEFTVRQESDWEMAQSMVAMTKPEGTTPLMAELQQLHNRIALLADDMRQQGHRAVVVIATDGLPSDEYGDSSPQAQEAFAQTLKQLQLLPVWIVIRLFTNERDVISYYRKLDKKLELPMECIANFLMESREIHHCNPWLNYALPLHQCREMGFNHRVFDLLDERPLTKDDVYEFLLVFFGSQPFHNAPNIHTEWKEFLAYLKQTVGSMQQQWSPHSKKMEFWIDVKKLASEMGLRGSWRQRVTNSIPGALGGGWD